MKEVKRSKEGKNEGERNGIQEVSGSIPLTSTKGNTGA